ncbi:protein of unknown function DUF1222 [Heterostelium album PN500]|uniref:Lipase maturation factor 2 n=1 Tax=Heterostelium pallidum (strain ATCC 26659 / Pp 5 / PN500) TaxID=670386 RepID=D3BRM0_HETP5|nr:protein of unknown function DUF1222 [Heterostelium album PN500]EFA76052.1 protein of unknown function DUF1222 [Heterostelium album PN500]|eukprot:XP_020428186.1 protein of unknown function DUF1222 [Heterostelium album PN500]
MVLISEKRNNRNIKNVHKNILGSAIDYLLSPKSFRILFTFIYIIAIKSFIQFTITRRYFVPTEEQPQYKVIQWLLVRSLAILYFISFLSIKSQLLGLFGKNGVLPIVENVKKKREKKKAFIDSPSIFLLVQPYKITDSFLTNCCNYGLLCSTLLFLDICPTLNLFLLFTVYLSFKNCGGEFFQLQFDNLMLDTTFWTILLPPFRFIPFVSLNGSGFYHYSIWWMFHWMSIRLFFASGICKISSGDSSWSEGVALNYHFWTQPMPIWTSYIFNELPQTIKKLGCWYHFIVEIFSPILLMIPCFINFNVLNLILLQVFILASGNYGVFNLNSIIISATFWDDSILPFSFRNLISKWIVSNNDAIGSLIYEGFFVILALAIVISTLCLSYIPLSNLTRGMLDINISLYQRYMYVARFGLLNYYGLFASMTTTRREVIFKGSHDGKEWLQYEFNWKPGDLNRRPDLIIGHLPRLEWRLWFAQFETFGMSKSQWFENFCQRLLENQPEVVNMLRKNPFHSKKPKYLRCEIAAYEFSDNNPFHRISHKKQKEKDEQQQLPPLETDSQGNILKSRFEDDGTWWRKEKSYLYYPTMTLCENKLAFIMQQ